MSNALDKIMRGIDIAGVVKDAIVEVAQSKNNKLTVTEAVKLEPKITTSVEEAVAPVIENLSNNEPWWKSRVLRGAGSVLLGTAATAYLDFTDGTTPDVAAITAYVVTIYGALRVIYGRLTNKPAPTI